MGEGVPLDTFEKFLKVGADGEVGVLAGFVGPLHHDLVVVVVFGALPALVVVLLLCVDPQLLNSSMFSL